MRFFRLLSQTFTRGFGNYRFLVFFLVTAVVRSFFLDFDPTVLVASIPESWGFYGPCFLRGVWAAISMALGWALLFSDSGFSGAGAPQTPGSGDKFYKIPKTPIDGKHYSHARTGGFLYDYWPPTRGQWLHPGCRPSLNPDYRKILDIDAQGRQRQLLLNLPSAQTHLFFQQLWNPFLFTMVGFSLLAFTIAIFPVAGDNAEAVARVRLGIEELLQAFEMHGGGYLPFIEAHLEEAAVQPGPRIQALRLNLPGAVPVSLNDLLAFHDFLLGHAPQQYFEEIGQIDPQFDPADFFDIDD